MALELMPLTGEDLTSVTITPLTRGSNGSLTSGSAQAITAFIQEVDPTLEIQTEDIRPVNVAQMNEVPIGKGARLRIACLQRSDAANILNSLVLTPYFYFQVDWTQGAETPSFRGVLTRWNGGVKARGANPAVMELAPINEGTANLTS